MAITNNTQGYIYFLTDGVAIKIGFALNPFKRLRELLVAHHFPLESLGTISAPKSQERILHDRFKHLHIRGEWFEINEEICDLIDDFDEDGMLIDMSEHRMNLRLEKIRTRRESRMTDE